MLVQFTPNRPGLITAPSMRGHDFGRSIRIQHHQGRPILRRQGRDQQRLLRGVHNVGQLTTAQPHRCRTKGEARQWPGKARLHGGQRALTPDLREREGALWRPSAQRATNSSACS